MSDDDRDGLVDRRGLIGAAGMGLLLAGCHHKVRGDKLDPDGYCKNHGDPPGWKRDFTAEEMCVVLIQFYNGPAPKVIQGYIKGLTRTTDLKKLANDALKELAGTTRTLFYEIRYNFDRFSFRAPTKVVIFLNNLDTQIRFCEENQGIQSNRVIRFTPYTGISFKSKVPHFRATRRNKNFYGVERIEINELTGGAAYWLNFLNRVDSTSTQIKDTKEDDYQTWWDYSMNIHLLVKKYGNDPGPGWIPLVLDPDTGNMGCDP